MNLVIDGAYVTYGTHGTYGADSEGFRAGQGQRFLNENKSMIEPIETEPLEDISFEPEEIVEDEPEVVSEPVEPEAQELDYERIIGGVTERIAQAARQYQEHLEPEPEPDPYAEVAEMIWDDPSAAIQRTVDI